MNQSYPVGPGRSIKVYPGDKVDPSVWAYFEDASGYGTSSPALAAIMGSVASMFGGESGGSGETGKIYSGISNAFSATGLAGNLGNSRPAAYLNYILVDKDYKFLTMGWQVIPNTSFTKMEVKFSTPIVASEEGYMYVYLSYENESNSFVYFDDFNVSLQRSNVIQYNEYYPFGLQTSTSWTRDQTKENNYLYNAANELNKTSGWYEMYYRGYDPAIGRMLQVDPYAAMYASSTTYNYALNNPVMINDPSGGLVNVVGYTDSQLHTMYRQNRYSGGTADFGNWAADNLDGRDAGTRNINGGDGNNYAFDGGTLVKGGVWVEYSVGESDLKGGLAEVYASITVFEETGGTRFEPGTDFKNPTREYQMIGTFNASGQLDILEEKITYRSGGHTAIYKTWIYTFYDKKGNVVDRKGLLSFKSYDIKDGETGSKSKIVTEFDSITGGILGLLAKIHKGEPLGDSVGKKYLEFIFSPTGENMLGLPIEQRGNRLHVISSVHR